MTLHGHRAWVPLGRRVWSFDMNLKSVRPWMPTSANLKRWFGKRPATLMRKGRSFVHPTFEQLEERVLLDVGLPAALVVGRTLSAYFVGDIQNNRETITYTVYNEQSS